MKQMIRGVVLLALALGGCSLALAPQDVSRSSCTGHKIPIAVDVTTAVAALVAGTYLGLVEQNIGGHHHALVDGALLGAVVAVPFTVSAVYGVRQLHRCRANAP